MTDINQQDSLEESVNNQDLDQNNSSKPEATDTQEKVQDLNPNEESSESTTEVLEPVSQPKLPESTNPDASEELMLVQDQNEQAVDIDDQEKKPAKDATEEESKQASVTIDSVDHHTLSKKQLVDRLAKFIHNFELGELKGEVELIRSSFYLKHNQEREALKQEFVNQGGLESDYQPDPDALEQEFKDLMTEYRKKKESYFKEIEKQKAKNLEEKHLVIEGIKQLIDKDESMSKTFEEFRQLQQRWRDSGSIPQAEAKNLWETYHHHVENFYDYIKINRELRDLDFKKNLEQKEQLCKLAEELGQADNPVKAFNELQHLHLQWREIGPVGKTIREELWKRFKDASSVVNKNNQQYYEQQREVQKDNLAQKVEICETVEAINEKEYHSTKEWGKLSDKVLKLQSLWKEVGFVPRSQSDKVYRRFRKACDIFFDRKRDFYSHYKKEQEANLVSKKELVRKAEEMQNSEDWHEATEFFIAIQKEWKTIGPVSRKYSDSVWSQFRKACNHFFDRKNTFFASDDDKQQKENLEQKQALVAEVNSYTPVEDLEENKQVVKQFRSKWNKIGHVPFKEKENITQAFHTAISSIFSKLNLDEEEQAKQEYITKLEALKDGGDKRLEQESVKIHNKLKALEADIQVWENNIGFFSSSKQASDLVSDFVTKIENGKQAVQELKMKLRLINNLLRNR